MGNNGSAQAGGYGQAVMPYQPQSQPFPTFQHQHTSVEYSSGPPAAASQAGFGPGGPLGTNNPNMVWDAARGGYWVKETVVDQSAGYSDDSGGYTVYGGQPGKVIRKTKCCDEPEPNIIVHNHKKVIHYDSDSDDEITIVTPPPVVVCPPPPPVILLQTCCPEKPKPPCGPSAFFPEVRERPYLMETQVKQSSCMSGGCGGAVISCGPCGGGAGPSCNRCRSYH